MLNNVLFDCHVRIKQCVGHIVNKYRKEYNCNGMLTLYCNKTLRIKKSFIFSSFNH